MIYRSKKDVWLVALVAAAVSLPFVLGIYNLLVPSGNSQAGRHMILVGTVTGAVVLWLTYPLYYEVTSSKLIVRSGLMRSEIPLSSIEGVHPTRNPLSAPAWSFDRLRVDYRRNRETSFLLISPEDKTGFMNDIAASVVGLEVSGDRVIRIS